jgi:hypothetical protein
MYDYVPGVYKVINRDGIRVRGTPDTSHDGNIVRDENGNQIKLTIGKSFPAYRIITDKKGWFWAVITDVGAQQDHYVCLWNLNTRFAELVKPFPDHETKNNPVEDILARLGKLESWARTKGYNG